MDIARDFHNLLPGLRSGRLSAALGSIPGLKLTSACDGNLIVGDRVARCQWETNDAIRVSLDIDQPIAELAALRTTHDLPGNLRFARCDQDGLSLLADTQVNGRSHLPETFRGLQQGMLEALFDKKPPANGDVVPLGQSDVDAALHKCDWGEETLVSQETGWEVRPRRRGQAVPVKIAIAGRHLRFSRTAVKKLPVVEEAAFAVIHQALRLNAQLLQARVAMADDCLKVETMLHAGQLEPAWIRGAAHAVAFAWQHVRPPLCVLAQQKDVAASYVSMFGCS